MSSIDSLTNWQAAGSCANKPAGRSVEVRKGDFFGIFDVSHGSTSKSQSNLALNASLVASSNWRMDVQFMGSCMKFNGGSDCTCLHQRCGLCVSAAEHDGMSVGFYADFFGTPPRTNYTIASAVHQKYLQRSWGCLSACHRITVPAYQCNAWDTATLRKVGDVYTVYFNGPQVYSARRTFVNSPLRQPGLRVCGFQRYDNVTLTLLP